MRPRDLFEATAALWRAGKNTFWWGPPGCGKTWGTADVLKMVPNSLLCDFPPGVTIEPMDAGGLPYMKDGQQHRARPDLWPTDEECEPYERVICFIDELPQSSSSVQASLMQAVWGHRVGKHKIPKNVIFHACGNRQTDRAGANRILTPLLDRFFHFDYDSSVTDWLDWAYPFGIKEDVRAFISFKPGMLTDFKPELNERSFPTQRGWHQVSDILPFVDDRHLLAAVTGKVGPGAAAEFIAFREVRKELPTDRAAIYKSPRSAPIPMEKPVVIYALALAIAEDSRDMPNLDPVATYCQRFPEEMSAFALREVYHANVLRDPKSGNLKAQPKIQKGEMIKWCLKHKDIIEAACKS